jgi:hypothetical protein
MPAPGRIGRLEIARQEQPSVLERIPITASRTSGFEPYRHRLQAASYHSLYRPEAVVETDLAGRLDFRQLFARLDEPDE